MTYTPLSSGNLAKFIIFITYSIFSCLLFGIGIIPFIIILWGILMVKRTSNFHHIEIAYRNYKYLMILITTVTIIIGICLTIVHIIDYNDPTIYWYRDKSRLYSRFSDSFITIVCGVIIPTVHTLFARILFLKPLQSHENWIVKNGFFSSKEQEHTADNLAPNIIKGEKLKAFSVADELLKWAKLKEDGHISQEEYEQARKKLLTRD